MKTKLLVAVTAIAALSAPAFAADLPVKAPPRVAAPAYTWTGFYVGADLGGVWKHNTATWNPLPSSAAFGVFPISGDNNGSGVTAGFHAGYNWQFAPTWVVGLEGDWSWANAKGTLTQPWLLNPGGGVVAGSFTTMSTKLDWLASIRGRLGFLVTPSLLVYGTAGVGFGDFKYTAANSNGLVGVANYTTAFSSSTTETGWVAGGGVEWAFWEHWSVRAEYLHYGFDHGPNAIVGAASAPAFPSNYVWSRNNVDVGRAGVSYKF